MKRKKLLGIIIGFVAFIGIALFAMTSESNYSVNPCPNAPHNKVGVNVT